MLKSIEFLSGKSRGRVGGGTKPTSPVPVILGLVPRILFQRVSILVNKLALLLHKCQLREDSWDKPKNDWCRGRGFGTFSQSGRSMIEMLGVLAIIGVLSIGGIAGYSKAMEKWKINKTIGEYSMLIYGLLEHVDDIKKHTAGFDDGDLMGLAKALNLIPNNWIIKNNVHALDSMGNLVIVYNNPNAKFLTVDFYLGGVTYTDEGNYSANFSEKLCTEIYNNIAIPLHGAVERVSLYQPVSDDVIFDGDKNCTSARPCLNNLKLDEIHKACSACNKSKEVCSVTLFF